VHGLHKEMGIKGIVFSLIVEFLFLGFCTVFIGYGLSELKRRKNTAKNFLLVILGFSLAGLSLYITKLFIQG